MSALPSIAASAQQPKKNHALSLCAPYSERNNTCYVGHGAAWNIVPRGIPVRMGYRPGQPGAISQPELEILFLRGVM